MIVRFEFTVKLSSDPSPLETLEYTGKLSKTILAKLSPNLAVIYKRRQRGPPKPTMISPPLQPGTLNPLAPLIVSLTRPEPEDFTPTLIHDGRILIHASLPGNMIQHLPKPGTTATFKYKGHTVNVELEKIRAVTYTPPTPETLERVTPTITIITPYLPKDPYTHSKYSSFNLAPDTTLSIPAYITAKLLGRKRSLTRTLTTLRKCLILPHTGYCRLQKTWYLTRTHTGTLKPIPTLTGTLQYKLNTYDCKPPEQQLTKQILHTAKTTGIGKSRTNGLGTLKP